MRRISTLSLSTTALVFVSVFLLTPLAAHAATYYVNNSSSSYVGTQGTYGVGNDTTGNGSLSTPWKTMNKANNTASSGDTVYVAQGTYSETVSGNYWALIFKDGVNWTADGNVIVEESAGTANYSAISIAGATATTITGFTFDGLNQKSYVLYPQTNAANKTFVNCTFRNSVNYQVYLYSSSNSTGFSFSGSTFNTAAAGKSNIQTYFPVSVTGSRFTSTTGAAFLNSYSSSGTTILTGNTFTANYGATMNGIGIYGTGSTYNIGTQESPNTFTLTSFVGQLIYANVATGNVVNVIGNTFDVYSAPAQASLLFYYGASATQGTSTVTYNTVNVLSSGSGGLGATNSFAFLYAHGNSSHEFDWLLDIEHNTLNINNNCATNSAGSSYLISLFDQPRAATIAYNTFNIADTSGGVCEAVWISSGIAGYANGAHTISYNTITTNAPIGHAIDVGYDGGYIYNHNISGVTISYNSITGVIGPSASDAMHLILYAYADNGLIHHNILTGGAYGIVIKGGNEGGANNWNTGKCYDNIMLSQNTSAIYIKGVQNVQIYNNTAYETGTYAAAHGALYITTYDNNDPIGTIAKNNAWYTSTYGVWWDGAGSLTSDYNLYYVPGGSYGYINTTTYPTLVSWQGVGYDLHGTSSDPLFTDATSHIFTLQNTSPVIDAGTSISGLTTDYTGTHPIYGTPDIGAYEYQPPYLMGTNAVNATGNIRIYGDGKYRYTSATTTAQTVPFTATPTGGSFTSYGATDARPQWLDISNIVLDSGNSYAREWVASSTNALAGTVVFTVGGLVSGHPYTISVDGTPQQTFTASGGQIAYTYSGGWSTHTFDITPDTTPPVITLTGSASINLHVGDTYTEQGATAIDNIDGTVSVTIGGDTVNTAVPGVYHITYDAVDAAGNHAAQVIRTVTVSDVSGPVFSGVPSNITAESNAVSGMIITYTNPTATDAIDGARSVFCTPASGSTFALGATSVTCSSTDLSSNTSYASFTVTVTTPPPIQKSSTGFHGQSVALPQRVSVLSSQTATTQPKVPTSFTRNLTTGSTGADVTSLQKFLISHGYTISSGATGYFGSQTRRALAAYQKAKGITPAVGYFGSITRTAIKGMM